MLMNNKVQCGASELSMTPKRFTCDFPSCVCCLQGCVIALDKSPGKIARVQKSIERFALSNIHCYAFNATKCLSDNVDLNKGASEVGLLSPLSCVIISISPLPRPTLLGPLPHAPPYPRESFDRVLLDAPCSALGQRPQIKCPLSLVELKAFQSYQRQFLTQVLYMHVPLYPTQLIH